MNKQLQATRFLHVLRNTIRKVNASPRVTATTTLWVIALAVLCPLYSHATETNCEHYQFTHPTFGAECHAFKVLEFPSDPNSRELSILTMRLPAIQAAQKPPIFFISGGPGQAATDLLPMMRHMFSSLLVHHDFVFVDQRGTGHSAPLDCDFDYLEFAHLPHKKMQQHSLKNLEQCIKNYDADLTAYTTPFAVHDLELVRKQLGYKKILLWGASYGTRVILDYMRTHPEAIAGATLDAVAPVAMRLPTYSERDASNALAHIFTLCKNDTECNKTFPELESAWRTLVKTLNASPQKVILEHPRTQQKHEVFIDGNVVSAWVRTLLYSREISPVLPLALSRATQNDFSLLFSVFALNIDELHSQLSEGMHSTILCAEDYQLSVTSDKKTQTKDDSIVKLGSTIAMEKTCELFPEPSLPEAYFEPVTSAVPTLLLSGKLDPVTPPFWGDNAHQTLSNSRHVIVPGGHHTVSRFGCLPDVVEDFFDAPGSLHDLSIECVDKILPAAFFIDSAGPSLVPSVTPKEEPTP